MNVVDFKHITRHKKVITEDVRNTVQQLVNIVTLSPCDGRKQEKVVCDTSNKQEDTHMEYSIAWSHKQELVELSILQSSISNGELIILCSLADAPIDARRHAVLCNTKMSSPVGKNVKIGRENWKMMERSMNSFDIRFRTNYLNMIRELLSDKTFSDELIDRIVTKDRISWKTTKLSVIGFGFGGAIATVLSFHIHFAIVPMLASKMSNVSDAPQTILATLGAPMIVSDGTSEYLRRRGKRLGFRSMNFVSAGVYKSKIYLDPASVSIEEYDAKELVQPLQTERTTAHITKLYDDPFGEVKQNNVKPTNLFNTIILLKNSFVVDDGILLKSMQPYVSFHQSCERFVSSMLTCGTPNANTKHGTNDVIANARTSPNSSKWWRKLHNPLRYSALVSGCKVDISVSTNVLDEIIVDVYVHSYRSLDETIILSIKQLAARSFATSIDNIVIDVEAISLTNLHIDISLVQDKKPDNSKLEYMKRLLAVVFDVPTTQIDITVEAS